MTKESFFSTTNALKKQRCEELKSFLESREIRFITFNNGIHFSIYNPNFSGDYWPSTYRTFDQTSGKSGKMQLHKLMEILSEPPDIEELMEKDIDEMSKKELIEVIKILISRLNSIKSTS